MSSVRFLSYPTEPCGRGCPSRVSRRPSTGAIPLRVSTTVSTPPPSTGLAASMSRTPSVAHALRRQLLRQPPRIVPTAAPNAPALAANTRRSARCPTPASPSRTASVRLCPPRRRPSTCASSGCRVRPQAAKRSSALYRLPNPAQARPRCPPRPRRTVQPSRSGPCVGLVLDAPAPRRFDIRTGTANWARLSPVGTVGSAGRTDTRNNLRGGTTKWPQEKS